MFTSSSAILMEVQPPLLHPRKWGPQPKSFTDQEKIEKKHFEN